MSLETTLNLLALVLSGGMAALLAAVLWFYASPTAHTHYRHWAAAWASHAAYYLLGALSFGLGSLAPLGPAGRFALSGATQVASVLGALLLVIGAVGYVERRRFTARALGTAVLVAVVLGLGVAALSQVPEWRVVRQLTRALLSAASFLLAGGIVLRHRRARGRPGRLLGLTMAGFGLVHLHYFAYAVLSAMDARPPYSLGHLTIFDVAWITAIVTTMIALAFADEQEEAAAKLRQRESEFRQMIENSSDLVMILERDLTLRYASPSCARVLGWEPALVGRPIAEGTDPDDVARLVALAAGGPAPAAVTTSLRLRHAAGNWVRVEAVATRTRDGEGVERLILNARDLAERERLEASLRDAQRRESVGRLAGGVAHDLNNILSVITGNVELGMLDASGATREHLQQVADAAARASALTRQLLGYARRQVVLPRRFDVWEAVSATTRMAARLLPASIELRVHPPAESLTVQADPGQLEQVLMNLVVNARDAIRDHGTVDVGVGVADVGASDEPDARPGRYVTISVRDSGAGIPEHVRAHLFEPFFTTKAVGEGTGLGLATSHGIVLQAGGFIRVESEMGVGSRFIVHLPLVEPGETEVASAAPEFPPAQDVPLLVVEDDKVVRDLLRVTLERAGYRVSTAANGQEALETLESGVTVAAIVTDVVMPRMGGLDLMRTVRARWPDVGVVLLSGYPGEPDLLRDLPSRAVFLQKPFQSAELVGAVRRVTGAD